MSNIVNKLLQSPLVEVMHPDVKDALLWAQSLNGWTVYRRPLKIEGLYFRQYCADLELMNEVTRFYIRPSLLFSNLSQFINAMNSTSRLLEKPETWLTEIESRIQQFKLHVGGNSLMLPWSEHQAMTFRVNPYREWSHNATAIFYQHYRIGYLASNDAWPMYGCQGYNHAQLEASKGYIHHFQSPKVAYLQLMIPPKIYIEQNPDIADNQPVLIRHENGSQGIMPAPRPRYRTI